MTRTVRQGCFAVAVVLVAGYAYAQSFNLRTGQWDFTMTGMASVLGDLSQLPPEARAQLEAAAKQPQNYKSCVTAQDLNDLSLGQVDDDEDCKVTAKKISGTTADVTRECTGDDKHTETIHYEAVSPESLRATINSVSARGKGTITITGKWVGATCKEE